MVSRSENVIKNECSVMDYSIESVYNDYRTPSYSTLR